MTKNGEKVISLSDEMRRFLLLTQSALLELAAGDPSDYNQLMKYISDKGLEGVDLDEIVERGLL
jgi:hypothetical protein